MKRVEEKNFERQKVLIPQKVDLFSSCIKELFLTLSELGEGGGSHNSKVTNEEIDQFVLSNQIIFINSFMLIKTNLDLAKLNHSLYVTVVPRKKCDMLQGTYLGALRHITT